LAAASSCTPALAPAPPARAPRPHLSPPLQTLPRRPPPPPLLLALASHAPPSPGRPRSRTLPHLPRQQIDAAGPVHRVSPPPSSSPASAQVRPRPTARPHLSPLQTLPRRPPPPPLLLALASRAPPSLGRPRSRTLPHLLRQQIDAAGPVHRVSLPPSSSPASAQVCTLRVTFICVESYVGHLSRP
uniref:Uncharacterized protein n=1 Tax=Aegilops tauschii subsp. strangulata TaxID=200361 RepID=A0A452ZWQ3_AEGTS